MALAPSPTALTGSFTRIPAPDVERPGTGAGATLRDRIVQPAIGPSAEPNVAATGNAPPPPGSLGIAPIKVPSRFLKDQLVTPHLAPDVAVDVDARTSVGIFGDVGRIDARLLPSLTRTTRDPVATRDLGAGLTLQYKFGQ